MIDVYAYTSEERQKIIRRFKKKKLRRNYSSSPMYPSRSKFAKERPRVGGRFQIMYTRKAKLERKSPPPRGRASHKYEAKTKHECKPSVHNVNVLWPAYVDTSLPKYESPTGPLKNGDPVFFTLSGENEETNDEHTDPIRFGIQLYTPLCEEGTYLWSLADVYTNDDLHVSHSTWGTSF